MAIIQNYVFPPAGEALNPQVNLAFADLIAQINSSLGASTAAGTANTLAYYTSATAIGSLTSATISGGALTLTSALTITPTSNQLVLGTTRTVTLTAPTPASSSRTITFPDLSADYSIVGTAGTQSIGGVKTFTSNIVVQGSADFQSPVQITAQSGSALAVTSTYVSNELGISISNTSDTSGAGARFFLSVAGSTADDPSVKFRITGSDDWAIGLDNSDSDKFKISKDFSLGTNDYLTIDTSGLVTISALAVTATSNQLVLGTTRTVTITAPTPATASRTWTIPDITAAGTFAALEGTQTFSGSKTFSSAVTVTATTNQLVLSGPTRTATITAPQPATSSRTYTFPDLSADYSVVGTEGTQTVNGAKTFSDVITTTVATSNSAVLAQASRSGNSLGFTADNTSNTANSNARLLLQVAGSSAGDAFGIAQISGGQSWSWGLDNSDSDKFKVSASSALGSTDCIAITSAGEITQPLQPSFLVTDGTGASNVTGDGTEYTELWPTEVYDQGADFSSNTFTAPVDGRYALNVSIRMEGMTTGHTTAILRLVTTNRTYAYSHIMTSPPFTTKTFHICVLADMDSGDTATTTIQLTGGTKVADIVASALANFFSGSLIN